MSNKRSILRRGRRSKWDSGYVKPAGRFAKRCHNKKVRKHKGIIPDNGGYKRVAPMPWEWS